MSDTGSSVQSVTLEKEMQRSYLDYAMSVIVGRALPDCRDGLKHVHRRILYAMQQLGNTPNKPYKKSARIVGDVVGKYHPHGEMSVYDSIVRMAQDFSMRYQIVDGQGNFGSIDGDSAAAMRYTEIKLRQYALTLLQDLDKDTVNFSPNYDGSEQIPDVLPTLVPNFLINGTTGIAVGMATQTPPHHLGEVMRAFLHYARNPEATVTELMEYLPGPDFPTGAKILGVQGIYEAYSTGKGRLRLQAVADIEEGPQRNSIIITQLPYQVNKARLIEKIAELVREKKIEGIAALRDESDKDGMRIVIEVKRDANDQVLLNQLYQQTQLQTTFAINMVGIAHGRPELLNLKSFFGYFLSHRQEILLRRTQYDLNKAKNRLHVLQGLVIALDNIDEILALIKSSPTSAEAKERLVGRFWAEINTLATQEHEGLEELIAIPEHGNYGRSSEGYRLSVRQAETILEMRLNKLTSMEQETLRKDYMELIEKSLYFHKILNDAELRLQIIEQESEHLIEEFEQPRKTEILMGDFDEIENEDLIPPEQVVITLSRAGYIKTQPLSVFEAQRRGGKGKSATRLKETDSVERMLVAHSHDHLLCFSTRGKVYVIRVFSLPSGARYAAGKPIVNCLPLMENEKISALLPIQTFEGYAFMTTEKGVVKKVDLKSFANTRSNGIIAIDLDEDDNLPYAFITSGSHEIMLFTSQGKSIRFCESEVRPTGRSSRGVRGIMAPKAHIVSAFAVDPENDEQRLILSASAHGFGKCTPLSEFNAQSRGGMGVIALTCSDRNGAMIGALLVSPGDQTMLLSKQGMMLRTDLENIPVTSRNTQGVRLVRLKNDDTLAYIEGIDSSLMGEDIDDDEEEL